MFVSDRKKEIERGLEREREREGEGDRDRLKEREWVLKETVISVAVLESYTVKKKTVAQAL